MGSAQSNDKGNSSVHSQANNSTKHSDKQEASTQTSSEHRPCTPKSDEDLKNASEEHHSKGHSSSKTVTAEFQIQCPGTNGDARTEDSGLKDATYTRISATPYTARQDDRDDSANRHNDVSYKANKDENRAINLANDIEMLHEYKSKVKSLEAQVSKLTKEKDTLLNRQTLEGLEQQNEDGKNTSGKTKEQKRHDNVSYTANKDENRAPDLGNDRKKLHEYERKVESLEAQVSKMAKEKDTLLNRHDDVSYTANKDENRATDLANDIEMLHEYKSKIKSLEVQVNKLTKEKDTLLNRLSEIGAIKLTENNPKVTDLSDENRPEKVVEQLSEIYENEWTDAYENLTKKQGRQMDWSIKQLLEVLKETYTICLSSTEEKRNTLREAISNYVGLAKMDSDDLDLKEAEKRIQEYRMKMLQRNFTIIGEEVRDQLKRKLETEIYESLSNYIGRCVIICWNICTKEPPMHLDFGDWKQTAQSDDKKPANMHFDKSKFVSYTKSGDCIDYVVWPAVYRYDGGPIMRKGVAQGSK